MLHRLCVCTCVRVCGMHIYIHFNINLACHFRKHTDLSKGTESTLILQPAVFLRVLPGVCADRHASQYKYRALIDTAPMHLYVGMTCMYGLKYMLS